MDPAGKAVVYRQEILSLNDEISLSNTLESKFIFAIFSLIASIIIIFLTRFFLGKIDLTVIIDPDLDSDEELGVVTKFLKMNSEKIQSLHSLFEGEKEKMIKELVIAFFLTFGSMEKQTEEFINGTLLECEFSKLFDHCKSLGVKSYEDIIRYIFTIVAKKFMQKVIENSDANKEGELNEEDSFIRKIDNAITAIEGDVAALNYLFDSNR